MSENASTVKPSRHHVAFGVALVAARGAGRATSAALRPARLAAPVAGAVWRSPTLSPARRTLEREAATLASLGRREEQDIRRRLEGARERLVIGTLERPELERLLAAALDSPAMDRIVQRVLQSPGVERAVVQVLESELLLESTERALRSEEVRRVVEWIANNREISAAVFQQSAGLADVVGRQVRGRSATADDAAERLARRLLRRDRHSDGASGS
jgi:hypothetical protein